MSLRQALVNHRDAYYQNFAEKLLSYGLGRVVDYRDMVVIVRDVIADMIKQGMTLDQIKAAHPARPYETEYGTQEGSTSAFVEAVYKSLTAKK